MYVDVHTHLTHSKFESDWRQVIARAEAAGVKSIVVNGLEPRSNRQILEMADEFDVVQAALGIYPIDAINHILPEDFQLSVAKFDVDKELEFIASQAAAGKLFAVGECGLDGYWVDEDTYSEQERVFRSLIEIALSNDLPLIIHTRKLEVRSGEILKEMGVKRVNFHCFGGKTKIAQRFAEESGWWFSIPANARKNQGFAKMLANLPLEKILTETDAPYLGPVKEERNEPKNVVGTVEYLAELRGMTVEEAAEQVRNNYQSLFFS